MESKKLKEISQKILSTFVNELGLDGDFYASTSKAPIIFGETAGLR